MKVRDLFGKVFDVTLTTDHPASSYGMPVPVTQDNEALDWGTIAVIEASPEERELIGILPWAH